MAGKFSLKLSSMVSEKNRKWWALGAMVSCISMMMIDQTVLPLALPTIQRDLHVSNVALQWVINAYMLGVAAFVLAGGRLADLIGRRFIFCTGSLIFAIASALGGISPNASWLIFSRALQGLGGALMGPATMAIIIDTFALGQRGKAIGIYVGAGALFLSLGPLIGGFLTNYVSWRWIFWINLPVSIVGILLALIFVAPSKPLKERFSWGSFLTFAIGTVFLVVVLMQGREWGWDSRSVIISLSISIISLILFYILDRRELHPAIDLSLFRTSTFTSSSVVIFFLQFVLMVTVFWGLYFQNILGYSPMETGLITSISCLPITVVPVMAGHMADRTGPKKPILIGLGILFFSFVWFIFNKYADDFVPLIPALITFGCGIGLVNTPTSSAAISCVPTEKRGSASGTLSAIRWAGATMGVALLGSILNNIQYHTFEGLLAKNPMTDDLNPRLFEGLFSKSHDTLRALHHLKSGAANWIEASLKDAFLAAFWSVNITAGFVVFIVFIFVLWAMKKYKNPH
jgi:EmrB/QacA subfamily drug resistance transporter